MKRNLLFAGLALLGLGATAIAIPQLIADPIGELVVKPINVEAMNDRVDEMDLSDGEQVWERIPWATDLDTAMALSKESNRPVFLFSMWGELDSRC